MSFNPSACRRELAHLKKLLDSKVELGERADIQAFFHRRRQLSAFLGTFVPHIGPANLIAFEFPFLGDFSADIVLGNRDAGEFCVVEFEDGKSNSIFRKVGKKLTTEWSPRFEHGFSQLVDWCCTLDDFKKTDRFARDYGHGYIRFHALLILGTTTLADRKDTHRFAYVRVSDI
jgi:hypothetical protein